MSDFVVLAWREDAAVRAKDIKERLAADTQWRLVIDAAHMAVFLSRERPLPLLRLPGVTGVVMGSVFDTAEANAGRGQLADLTWLCGDSPTALCRRLSREAWGSYVAVLPDGDGALPCRKTGTAGRRLRAQKRLPSQRCGHAVITEPITRTTRSPS